MIPTVYHRRRFRLGLAVVAGLAFVGGYWLFGPHGERGARAAPVGAGRVALDAEQRRLSDLAGELERTYERRLAAGDKDEAGEPAFALLGRAIAAERDLLRRNPQAGLEHHVRLERLETARDNERAKAAAPRIAALERAAETERRAGRTDAAQAQMRAALQAQREVNDSQAAAAHKDFARERALALAVETLEAEPLHRSLTAAMQEARAASADRRWAEALTAFVKARDAQRTLNQRYSRTRFVDRPGLDAIEAEIASLQAADVASDIEAKETAGDAAADRGRAQEAAGLYAEAAARQREVNGRFARSRFASGERVERLEAKGHTVQAAELLTAAATLDRAAAEALRKRQVLAAGDRLAQAAALLAHVEAQYPKARDFDAALKLRLAYLDARRAELRALQDGIYERLAPVPEAEGRLMLRTEVPQELYTRIMSANPSREAGPARPVDSVSWHEAQEFCRRVSWLLGTRVRLPAAAEFRAALAEGDAAAWSADNAGGRGRETGRQAPNAAGFFDLAGNLAEWLDAGAGDEASVAGGSYLDPAAALGTIAPVAVAKQERARHIGFRVVVEVPVE